MSRDTLNERVAIFLDQWLRDVPGSGAGALLAHAVTQHRDQPLLANAAHVLLEEGFGDLARVSLSSLQSCETPLFPIGIVHACALRPCLTGEVEDSVTRLPLLGAFQPPPCP